MKSDFLLYGSQSNFETIVRPYHANNFILKAKKFTLKIKRLAETK